MQFILVGFNQDTEFRTFAFQGIAADRTRSDFTVRADLVLSRKYGIRVQELPLLCRRLLERDDRGEEKRTLTFTEEDMRLHANTETARVAANPKKKWASSHASALSGQGSRVGPEAPGS
jgi:hypothetical protein